jgi:single-strand DNA-binding protein
MPVYPCAVRRGFYAEQEVIMPQRIRLPEQNSVVLVGRLTHDPDVRYLPKGDPVCRFSLAVNRRYKDTSGNWKDDTSFIPVVVWREAATRCSERLKKGFPVFVSGRLKSRSWEDKDGKKHSALEVNAQRIQFLQFSDDEPKESAKEEGTVDVAPAAEEEDIPF